MSLQKIKLADFANTKRWKEIEKAGGQGQIMFRLGHLNPEYNIDPVYGQANKILKQEQRGKVIETTSTVGIATKKGKMADFYDVMVQFAQAGLLKGFSVEEIKAHREKVNQLLPEECDFWTDIAIADYQEEEIASQGLENLANQFTEGLVNVPVPGAVNNMTLKDVFQNPLVRAEAKKRGVAETEMSKALEKITKASQQAVRQIQESKVKYQLGKFNKKYPAVYCLPPLIVKNKSKTENKNEIIKIKNPDGSTRTAQLGGGGSDTRFRLPANAFEKEDYPIEGRLLQAIQVKNYLITGNLLTALHCLPSARFFCQSLTKFKTITQTTRQGELTFIDHFIVPVNSNLGKEGYLNREEAENMLLSLLSGLEEK
jgi:hypothetical protein